VISRPPSPSDTDSRSSLRVALVSNSYSPHVGGVETHVQELATSLQNSGIAVEILTQESKPGAAGMDLVDGIRVRRFRSPVRDQRNAQSPGLWLWAARNLGGYDLIHIHSYHAFVSFGAGAVTRVPLIFTPHYHGTGHTRARTALHHVYRPFGAHLFRRSSAIICVSAAESALVERDFACTARKIHVIPNGVDVAAFRRAQAITTDHDYVLCVARLEPYKQIHRVITAFAALPAQISLVVIGSGPERRTLEELTMSLGVSHRVRFLDGLPTGELRSWIAGASVLVSMSTHEAFGLTLLESLAAGRPVVASDISAHRDVCAYDATGSIHLVPPDSADDVLAAALRRAIPSTRRLDLGRAVPLWSQVAHETLDVYGAVLGQSADPATSAPPQCLRSDGAGRA